MCNVKACSLYPRRHNPDEPGCVQNSKVNPVRFVRPVDARCPTTSGHFRCEREAGHPGDCEAQASEYATARLPCVIAAVPVAAEARPVRAAEEPSK